MRKARARALPALRPDVPGVRRRLPQRAAGNRIGGLSKASGRAAGTRRADDEPGVRAQRDVGSSKLEFLLGVPVDHVLGRLAKAGGNETTAARAGGQALEL